MKRLKGWANLGKSYLDGDLPEPMSEYRTDRQDVDVVVSRTDDPDQHMPCFDVDHMLELQEMFDPISTTWLLRIHKPVTPEQFDNLARACSVAGIIDVWESHTDWTPERFVLELNEPTRIVPSETEGHFHLYIDAPMSQADYWTLLDAFVAAGVVEANYVSVSKERGFTRLALTAWKKAKADRVRRKS